MERGGNNEEGLEHFPLTLITFFFVAKDIRKEIKFVTGKRALLKPCAVWLYRTVLNSVHWQFWQRGWVRRPLEGCWVDRSLLSVKKQWTVGNIRLVVRCVTSQQLCLTFMWLYFNLPITDIIILYLILWREGGQIRLLEQAVH